MTDQLTVRPPTSFFIGGEWVKPKGQRKIQVISPVTEKVVMEYPEASQADIDDAVQAARNAFETGPWPKMAPRERAAILRRTANELESRAEEIAQDWTTQIGAPILIGRMLAPQNAQIFRFYADLLEQDGFSFVDQRTRLDGGRTLIVREPVGVCATVTPWNAAMILMSYKIAAGLASGCTFVSKPSPETPLEGYVLAECLEAAGLPKGVFNLVPAGAEVGEYLVRHAGIDKVAFTGSTAAGKKIAAICTQRLARVTLELGGKSAAILLDDADFAAALPSIALFAMPSSGQVCFALTRILVPKGRAEELTSMLVQAISQFKVGDPSDPQVFMGPLSKASQYQRVMEYIAKGKAEGATLALGGGRPEGIDTGYYIAPTIFADVTPEMTIAQEEIFGPVVAIMAYEDEEDAIRIANDSRYGLSGSVFSSDVDRALRVARRIRTGNLTINGNVVDPTMPIGGFKESGWGREGGIEGMNGYLEAKTISFA
ncbi:aldehyde dehydrogenase [Alcaligenaceae bacterium A4P071]|uniref:aldehyde dehydrogenase n=1 Tax=Xanthomonas sp. CFBP 8151 TaxID=3035310 RepID=UPI00141B5C2F|nr:aldehyde dehydrogenase [Xanthomonas sp. CFBP 8151]MDQ2140776.1 aldehyde dehydrogenase [Alcaligenaceae bacterium B3P038]MDQ2148695.1 aldehyde dehydrogenase [Alcaligenaceae bacterium C4P045]MDQ2188202.1 aldehyde dehydrogenase [Alcaligenaceae bacterium A4P071]MEB1610318.1 aldehyde dehydrogenase [Xanthomonas campestris pv. campestris]NIJ75004.1 aldehyde dehydrogenase (NAD+) [Xanthomonas sp. CFBP 8151]